MDFRVPDDIEHWVRHASLRDVIATAAAARSGFRTSVATTGGESDARAAFFTLHRSGYVRERGLVKIVGSREPFVLPFLLLRLDDIVPTLRVMAENALAALLVERFAESWVRSLRLVELLRGRQRSGGGNFVAEIRSFLSRHPAALAAGVRDEDPFVRLRSLELADDTLMAPALEDADLRVRLYAARRVVSRSMEVETKRTLLPVLERSASATMRLFGLRGRMQLDPSDDAPFERALLDHHAAVRFFARATLRARHPDRAFGQARSRALSVLETSTATDDVVGALGALSDVGIRDDASRVRSFCNDSRKRVRREAIRTLSMLEA